MCFCSVAPFQGSHIPVVNPLDTSAPVKRGKEREVPKVKKPSPLKKVSEIEVYYLLCHYK